MTLNQNKICNINIKKGGGALKVKVRYKQKHICLGIYTLYRIIDLSPNKKIFTKKIEKRICSTAECSRIEYCDKVRQVLSLSKKQLAEQITPDIYEYMSDPSMLDNDIKDYEVEIDI